MEHKLLLSPRTAEQIARLPVNRRNVVREHLSDLATKPVELSRPTPTPPYLPGDQMYDFMHKLAGETHHFVVLFKYHSDEVHLWITAITHGTGPLGYPFPY